MNKEKLLNTLKNRKVVAALCAALLLIIATVIIIVTVSLSDDDIVLDGSYCANVGEDVGADSVYVFDGNRATNTYFDGNENVVIEYTYLIEGKGTNKTIELTRVDSGKSSTYLFSLVTDENENITAIIINTVWYYKQ